MHLYEKVHVEKTNDKFFLEIFAGEKPAEKSIIYAFCST